MSALSNAFVSALLFSLSVASIAGLSLGNSRIYYGKEAAIGQFPYQASLRYAGIDDYIMGYCGAAIVSEKFVMAAAHCIQDGAIIFPEEWQVFVGIHAERDGQGYAVKKMYRHEKYNKEYFTNDISLVELKKSIEFSKIVAPIKINRKFIPGNVRAVVAGLGDTDDENTNLKYIEVETLSNEECRKMFIGFWAESKYINDVGTLCTYSGTLSGVFKGDSGGGLVHENTLIGIVSWGRPLGGNGYPDGYTRVSEHIKWIENIMGPIA